MFKIIFILKRIFSRNEKDNLLAILDDFINGKLSASKIESVVNIAKNLINEKAEWEIERKRLIEENSTLKEQLKILRSKQFGKSSEKTRKKIEELEQKIEENEIELELKSSKKGGEKEEKSVNKARSGLSCTVAQIAENTGSPLFFPHPNNYLPGRESYGFKKMVHERS